MNYNNTIWGNEHIAINQNINTDSLSNGLAISNSGHEISQIKSMVKLSDDSFVIVGKFKYIYLKKGTDKYRLEVNGIVKFNSDGTINESFLKFDNTNKLYWNGFNSPKLSIHYVTGVLYDAYGKEIKPSVNDIVAKDGHLYVCGGFSTYRGVGISNNKTELETYNDPGPEVDVMMYGRNSLIKISQTSGDLDTNTRFIFDPTKYTSDDDYEQITQFGGYAYLDHRSSVNTIVDYDNDNILVGGDFIDVRLYNNINFSSYKKSSMFKFNTTTNTVSNLWECQYCKIANDSPNSDKNFIYIDKGIHMDVGYKGVVSGNKLNIGTYESLNFDDSNWFNIKYDKKNKEIKKILVIEEQPGVKSFFVVGNFNCYLDGSKKHWLNKIIKFKNNGEIDPLFLLDHSATNYIYSNVTESSLDYIVNDKNTGFGFSYLSVGLNDQLTGDVVYMSDIKMVDSNGIRVMFDDNGDRVTSGGRYVAYDDEILNDNIYKSYVSDIIYHDNKILVCGRFNYYKNKFGDYKNIKNIIRLNLDGSVDTIFDTSNNTDLDNFYSIDSIKLVNSGNNILIGGRPKYHGVLNVLQAGETNNVFLKLKSNGDNVNGSDNNLKFRYYSINDNTNSTFIAKIPFINKIF